MQLRSRPVAPPSRFLQSASSERSQTRKKVRLYSLYYKLHHKTWGIFGCTAEPSFAIDD